MTLAPNFDLMLWIIFIMWVLRAIAGIILGSMQKERDTKYDWGDVVIGILTLVAVAFVMFT